MNVSFVVLRSRQKNCGKVFPDRCGEAMYQLTRKLRLLIDRNAEPQSEFSIVFKQRVRPRRPASLGILGPRRRRQIAAIDRGAAGGVGNHSTVSKELRHELQIRSFTAPGTCAGELEQGFLHLLLANVAHLDLSSV